MSQKIKRPNAGPPKGITPSAISGLPITSIGIPTLDAVIGGGLPLGSFTLIETDDDDGFSKIIERCYLSLGDILGHQTYYANFEDDVPNLYQEGSSAPEKSRNNPKNDRNLSQNDMKIAWQYQNQSPEQMMSRHAGFKNKGGITIDMNKIKSLEEVASRIDFRKSVSAGNYSPKNILEELKQFYQEHNESLKNLPNMRMAHRKNCFRTLISGVEGAFWNCQQENLNTYKFLRQLKAITPQNSFTIITMPHQVVNKNPNFRRYFDLSIKLTNLAANIEITDEDYIISMPKKMGYHGLLEITKCQSAQSLSPILPDSNNLAFKIKKIGGLQVEILHLPPEDSVAKENLSQF